MSNFRDQLGEDWLRYQHHLEGESASNGATSVCTHRPTLHHHALLNGLAATTAVPCPSSSPEEQPASPCLVAPEVLPPPLLASEPKTETCDMHGDLETESTLQWPSQSRHTESTLDCSTVEGEVVNQGAARPESQALVKQEGVETKEEDEEEDLGGRH